MRSLAAAASELVLDNMKKLPMKHGPFPRNHLTVEREYYRETVIAQPLGLSSEEAVVRRERYGVKVPERYKR